MNAVASKHSGCVVSAEIKQSQKYDVMFRKVTGMHSILLTCVPMCMCVGGSQTKNSNIIPPKSSCTLKSYQDGKIILEGSRRCKYAQPNGMWVLKNSLGYARENRHEVGE